MADLHVVGLGAINVDRVYLVERVLLDGEAVVKHKQETGGGSAANTIYALAKLGLGCGVAGAVADDPAGSRLLGELRSVGVDVSNVAVKSEATTGEALCIADPESNRSIYLSPGANSKLTRDDIPMKFLSSARLVHFSAFADPTQKQVTRAIVRALPQDVLVSFAPGMVYCREGLGHIEDIIRRCQILFLNRQELKLLTGQDIPDGARVCSELGCRTVVVTLGGDSPVAAYIRQGEEAFMVSALKPRDFAAVDSIGAGDAFAAGYIWGFLAGKEPAVCGSLGHTMSLFAVSSLGARSGLPNLQQLKDRYLSLYGAGL